MHNITSMKEFLGILSSIQQSSSMYRVKPAIVDKTKPAVTFLQVHEHCLAIPVGEIWNKDQGLYLGRFGNKKTRSNSWSENGWEHVQFAEAFKEAVSYYKAHTKEVNAFVLSKHSEWTKPLTPTEKAKFVFRGITIANKHAFRVTSPDIDLLMSMTHPDFQIFEGTNDMILMDPAKHEVKEVHLTEQLKEVAEKVNVWSFLQSFIKTESTDGSYDTVSMGRTNDRMDQNYDLAFEVFHMKITPSEIEVGKKISRDLQATRGGRSARHDNIVRLHIVPWIAEAPEKHIGEKDPYREVAQVLLQDPDALAPYMEWLNKKQAKLLK